MPLDSLLASFDEVEEAIVDQADDEPVSPSTSLKVDRGEVWHLGVREGEVHLLPDAQDLLKLVMPALVRVRLDELVENLQERKKNNDEARNQDGIGCTSDINSKR